MYVDGTLHHLGLLDGHGVNASGWSPGRGFRP